MGATEISVQLILITIIIPLLCGLAGDRIINSKGYQKEENHGFLWGFLTSIIGIAVFFLTGMGILWGSFFGILGIIICCVKPVVSTSTNKTAAEYKTTVGNDKISEQIKDLSKLKEEGYITEEEYEAKKKKILGI